MVCRAWALQGYGTPLAGYALYGLKVVAYIRAWVFFCGFTAGVGGSARHGLGVAGAGAIPESIHPEPAVRDPRPRLRQRTAARTLLPAVRRVPLFSAPGHDEAAALSEPAAARRAHTDVARRR